MKYLFLVMLCWSIGFILPQLATSLQVVAGLVFVGLVVICVMYFIDTRINAVRL
ncbi:hypothetical protein [Neolewinella litorea]|uniref:hypothetical protein n=1 Tax=Neolewinella litorea TaxID=2562452 RepID=UPI00145624A7|nr:hypothetical protein [Neolewinella litorea]